MAGKKNTADSQKNYGRWDTITGTIKGTGRLTPTQKQAIAEAKAEKAKAKTKKKK